jgi:hypothetical protein
MMSKIYVIDVHETGGGLLIQESTGFRFFSADPTFSSLDGCLFRSPSEAEKVATRIGSASPTRPGRPAPAPSDTSNPSEPHSLSEGDLHVQH